MTVELKSTPSSGSQASGLRQKTVSGVLWSAVSQIGEQSLRFVITVILARILVPEDFGLLAMVTVFTGFASLFSTMGFSTAIIQKQDVTERHLCTVFWLGAGIGLTLTLLLVLSSSLIASFYNQPTLLPMTIAISFNFLIGSFSGVQDSLFIKRMDFRRLAIIKNSSIMVAGICSVTMALSGFGVWSLVANSILSNVMWAILTWHLSPWRPKFLFDVEAIKDLFGFSTNLVGSRVLGYWTSHIDNLLIGKYISSFALGIYSRAYALMLLPMNQLSWVLARVMFSALSIIQDDKMKVKDVFLRANRVLAFLSFPMMLGLLVVADSFILTIYGQKWEAVIVILQVLCIDGLRRSMTSTVSWIYMSQGRTDLMFKFGIFSSIVTTAGIIIGLQWDAIGVAVSLVLTGYVILWYPAIFIPGRLINLKFSEMLKAVAPSFYCSAAMALVVFGFRFSLPEAWPHWAKLAAEVSVGTATYGLLAIVFKVRAYNEIREISLQLLARKTNRGSTVEFRDAP